MSDRTSLPAVASASHSPLPPPTREELLALADRRGVDIDAARRQLEAPIKKGVLWVETEVPRDSGLALSPRESALRPVLGTEALWFLLNDRPLHALTGVRVDEVRESTRSLVDGANFSLFGFRVGDQVGGMLQKHAYKHRESREVKTRQTQFGTRPVYDLQDLGALGSSGITDAPYLPGRAGTYEAIESFRETFDRHDKALWGVLVRQRHHQDDAGEKNGRRVR